MSLGSYRGGLGRGCEDNKLTDRGEGGTPVTPSPSRGPADFAKYGRLSSKYVWSPGVHLSAPSGLAVDGKSEIKVHIHRDTLSLKALGELFHAFL